MTNKYKYLFFLIAIFFVNPVLLIADDIFQFNVTNIEITEENDQFRINTETDNQLEFALKLING